MSFEACEEYGPCIKVNINDLGVFSVEWYFLNITPLPNTNEIECVISDIINGFPVSMSYGQMVHNPECKSKNHRLPNKLKRVVRELKPQTFSVAIYSNHSEKYIGQPLAVCFDPVISFINYPDHPHLNMPNIDPVSYLPPTLCYTNTPEELGNQFGDRLFDALFYITEWLVRHQVWEKHRELYGSGYWIGSEADSSISNGQKVNVLNPRGRCSCGKSKAYLNCCMSSDLEEYIKFLNNRPIVMKEKVSTNPMDYIRAWNARIFNPEQKFTLMLKDTINQLDFGGE